MDIAALKASALQATEGPWSQHDDHPMYGPSYSHYVWGPEGPGHGAVMAAQEPNPHAQATVGAANARYIALANPTAILSLIERVEALEEALRDIASEDIDRIQDTTGPVAKGTLIGIVRIARAALSPTNTQADE